MKAKNNYAPIIAFIISPILSFPLIMDLIASRRRYAYTLLAIIMGLVVYMYEPILSRDLARYYLVFEEVAKFTSVKELLWLLEYKGDYFLYSFSFLLSRVGLDFQFYVLIVTIFNMLLLFSIYKDIIKAYFLTKQKNIILFGFFIAMVGLGWVIGVSRQFTAFALIAYCYYFGIIKREKTPNFIILASMLIHFSSVGLILIYFTAKYIPIKQNLIKVVFYASFTMYFIPNNFIKTIISTNILTSSYFSESDVYSDKLEAYTLTANDERLEEINNAKEIVKIRRLLFGTLPFLMLVAITIFSKILFDKFYYFLFIFINMTYGFTSIHGRHLSFLFIVFAIFYIKQTLEKKEEKFYFIIPFFYMILLFTNFYLLYKKDLQNIFFSKNILNWISILTKEINYDTLPL